MFIISEITQQKLGCLVVYVHFVHTTEGYKHFRLSTSLSDEDQQSKRRDLSLIQVSLTLSSWDKRLNVHLSMQISSRQAIIDSDFFLILRCSLAKSMKIIFFNFCHLFIYCSFSTAPVSHSSWVKISRRPEFFFMPYFHNSLSSVHYCEDHFHIHVSWYCYLSPSHTLSCVLVHAWILDRATVLAFLQFFSASECSFQSSIELWAKQRYT